MDPLSIAAGVTGLLLFVKETKTISTALYDTLKKKPQLLKSITDDLDGLQGVLKGLEHNIEVVQEEQERDALSAVLESCKIRLVQVKGRLDALREMHSQTLFTRVVSHKKFAAEMKAVSILHDQLASLKTTLNLALHIRAIKSLPQAASKDDISTLRAEISLLTAHLESSSSSQNPILQYIDASSAIVARENDRIEAGERSPGAVVENITHGLPPGTAKKGRPLRDDMENVKSFHGFDDWLSSFSPPGAIQSQLPSQPHHENNTASSSKPPGIVRTPLTKDSKIQITVTNLIDPLANPDCPLPSEETVELATTEYLYKGIQMLHGRGHKDVCGFRHLNHFIGPLTSRFASFPLYITEQSSSFSHQWLEINRYQELEQFYDLFERSQHSLKPLRISKNQVGIIIQDENDGTDLEISFNRTLRVPEDATVYNLPVLFGPFPLVNVDLLDGKLPESVIQKSGLLIPMYQREALSLGFREFFSNNKASVSREYRRDFAVKVLAGSVNTISGSQPGKNEGDEILQDYIVASKQARLDGFFAKAGVSIVRQFVAMAIPSGYTAEGQLRGDEVVGGIQLVIAPRFAGRGEFHTSKAKQLITLSQQKQSPAELGLGAGQVLLVSGPELAKVYEMISFKDEDPLCTGPKFFVRSNRYNGPQTLPYPDNERPVLVQEAVLPVIGGSECLTVQPVFRMTLTIESCLTQNFRPAKGYLNTGPHDPIGFKPDSRHDVNPMSVTWKVSPFMSLAHLFSLLPRYFDYNVIAVFHQDIQLDNQVYTPLHAIVKCGARLDDQGVWEISSPKADGFRMGDGPSMGGKMYQDIYIDPNPEWWNWKRSRLVNIQMVNAVAFKSFTGINPPEPPISFHDYIDGGLPFYHLIPRSSLRGSGILAKMKSVWQVDSAAGVTYQPVINGVAPVGCFVCRNYLSDTILRPCNHVFCKKCIETKMTFRREIYCSACMQRSSHQIRYSGPMEVGISQGDTTKEFQPSNQEREAGDLMHPVKEEINACSKLFVSDLQREIAEGGCRASTSLNEFSVPKNVRWYVKDGCRTPLQVAAEDGRAEVVEFLLQTGANPNEEDVTVAAVLAAAAGHLCIVKTLAGSKLNLTADDPMRERDALEAAAENGHIEIVRYLLDQGYRPRQSQTKTTALHRAAKNGHNKVVKLLLCNGHGTVESWGPTPAQLAARNGYQNVLEVLSSHGADMNSGGFGEGHRTPMHEAAGNGHSNAVSYLLGIGWRHNPHDWGSTPLELAAREGHTAVVELLVDITPVDGVYSALVEASMHNRIGVIELLSSHELISGNDQRQSRDAALLRAAGIGSIRAVQVLLELGADIHARDHAQSENALHNAARGGHLGTFDVLLSAGANLEAETLEGLNCLHIAAMHGAVEIAMRLLEKGFDPNKLSGKSKQAPLEYAIQFEHPELTDLLFTRGGEMDNSKLFNIAIERPHELSNRHFETVLAILSRFNIGQINMSESYVKFKLRLLVEEVFPVHGTGYYEIATDTASSVLGKVLDLSPGAVDDGLLFAILEGAARAESFSVIVAVIKHLPEETCKRLASKLATNPRRVKIAKYIVEKYCGPGAVLESKGNGEIEEPTWIRDNPEDSASPFSKKVAMDMTSNKHWDGSASVRAPVP